MRFLVDAQLPPLVAEILRERGHDAIHTRSLLLSNRTPDGDILDICETEERILLTKDLDFYHSKQVRDIPAKLVVIKTGNMRTRPFLDFIRRNVSTMESALEQGCFVEVYEHGLVILR